MLARWILPALIGLVTACGQASGTGGREVVFDLALMSVPQGDKPLGEFITNTGWEVELSQAYLAVGPIYLYENGPHLAEAGAWHWLRRLVLPVAHAHPGDHHFAGGRVMGEFLEQVIFDGLAEDRQVLGPIQGIAGSSQSFSVYLEPPSPMLSGGAVLQKHQAYVVGHASKDGHEVSFEGGLAIEGSALDRRAEGLPMDVILEDGGRLSLGVRLERWFAGAHFDRLETTNDNDRYTITPESQVRTAWFLGARSVDAFAAHWEDAP